MLRPLPWIANEDVKLDKDAHSLPLLHVIDPEVPLVQVKPGIFCIATQDVPLQVIDVE